MRAEGIVTAEALIFMLVGNLFLKSSLQSCPLATDGCNPALTPPTQADRGKAFVGKRDLQ